MYSTLDASQPAERSGDVRVYTARLSLKCLEVPPDRVNTYRAVLPDALNNTFIRFEDNSYAQT